MEPWYPSTEPLHATPTMHMQFQEIATKGYQSLITALLTFMPTQGYLMIGRSLGWQRPPVQKSAG
jgi:hypothetical protein